MKKIIKIEEIKVKSFITLIDQKQLSQTLKGGGPPPITVKLPWKDC